MENVSPGIILFGIMAEKSENKEVISKEVVESYIFSTVRHDFGIYSERLLLRLVELAQREIRGLDFKGGSSIGKVEIGEWGDAEVIISVKDILSGEDDKNYSKAKTAVRNLMGRFLEYEDNEKYRATQILNEVDVGDSGNTNSRRPSSCAASTRSASTSSSVSRPTPSLTPSRTSVRCGDWWTNTRR